MYEGTRHHLFESLYVDKYGQHRIATKTPTPDMQKFTLNKEKYNRFRAIMEHHKVIDLILSQENKDENAYSRTYH